MHSIAGVCKHTSARSENTRLYANIHLVFPHFAGVAELVDATDSRPVVARHESSSLSPGTKSNDPWGRFLFCAGEHDACASCVRDSNGGVMSEALRGRRAGVENVRRIANTWSNPSTIRDRASPGTKCKSTQWVDLHYLCAEFLITSPPNPAPVRAYRLPVPRKRDRLGPCASRHTAPPEACGAFRNLCGRWNCH